MNRYMLYGFLLFVIIQASTAKQCTRRETGILGYSSTTYFYCSYGCCGDYYNRYCCLSYSWGTGTIAGAVVGGIIGFVILVSLIVFCVKACTKTGSYGRVVQPGQNQGVFVVSSVSNQGVYPGQTGIQTSHHPPTAFGPQPPAYPGPSGVNPLGPSGVNPAIPQQYQPPPYSQEKS